MGPSVIVKGILILALGFNAGVVANIAACSRTVKAKTGDTCASLAAVGGITVTDFLRSNPSVTSCSVLSTGADYCLQGTAAAGPASTSTPASPTSGSLKISNDGTCGPGVTCQASEFGSCCSKHGFCGNTADYCGDGCQAGLGACGSQPGPSSTPPVTKPPSQGTATTTITVTAPATRTVVSTSTVTRISIVLQTSTSVVLTTSTAAATRTVLQTIPATAVATTTQTVRATVLTSSVVTLTSIVTSTSVVLRTSQVAVTQTARVTSVVIETMTTIKTVSITAVNTIGCNNGGPSFVTTIWQTGRPTTTGRPVATTVTQLPSRPTLYLPGSSRACKSYDQIQQGDTCRQIANRNSVTLLDFYDMNPSVSANRNPLSSLLCSPDLIDLLLNDLCKIDCDDLWPGYFVCVGE